MSEETRGDCGGISVSRAISGGHADVDLAVSVGRCRSRRPSRPLLIPAESRVPANVLGAVTHVLCE